VEKNQGWLLGFKNSLLTLKIMARSKTTVQKNFMKVRIHKKILNSKAFSLSAFE
jgi:hypothetical protein